MDAGQLNLQAPWFEAYKREFLRTMAFADHETFDYPVACGHLACAESMLNVFHTIWLSCHDVALSRQSMLFGTSTKPGT